MAAVARGAHGLGSMVVRGSSKPTSVSGEIAKSLAGTPSQKSSKAASTGDASEGNSKLGGKSSVPEAGGKSATRQVGAEAGSSKTASADVASEGNGKLGGKSSVPGVGNSAGGVGKGAADATAKGVEKGAEAADKDNGNLKDKSNVSETSATRQTDTVPESNNKLGDKSSVPDADGKSATENTMPRQYGEFRRQDNDKKNNNEK
jgi:hypothetical protein